MNKISVLVGSFALLLFATHTASAHTGLQEMAGFTQGVQHPFLGLDHFLVMFGLGLWMGRQHQQFTQTGVACFLFFMLVGAVLAIIGWQYVYVERVVVASLLLTALLLLSSLFSSAKVPGILLIALIALVHGQAHGMEMPVTGSAEAYISGFLLASLVLQVSGLFCARLIQGFQLAALPRVYASFMAVAGVYLWLSV